MTRDAHSFDEFYRQTSARLVRYGYAMVGDADEAQDVVQEAYIRAWRAWARLADHPAPEAWMRLVVCRLATDRWRRVTRWRAVLVRTGPPPDIGPPSENTVLLLAALRKLSPNHRQAVSLHYLFDLPIDAIAQETGAAVGTVKSWLYRGRAELAALLAEAQHGAGMEVNDVR